MIITRIRKSIKRTDWLLETDIFEIWNPTENNSNPQIYSSYPLFCFSLFKKASVKNLTATVVASKIKHEKDIFYAAIRVNCGFYFAFSVEFAKVMLCRDNNAWCITLLAVSENN